MVSSDCLTAIHVTPQMIDQLKCVENSFSTPLFLFLHRIILVNIGEYWKSPLCSFLKTMSSSYSEAKSKEFFDAVKEGNLPLVESLSRNPQTTSFFSACELGHVDIIRYLLDFHDNPSRTLDHNLEDNNGTTPFSVACARGHEKVVEILVADERIDVNTPDESGGTPLYWASYFGHVGVVKMLLASAKQIDTSRQVETSKKTAAGIAKLWSSEILRRPLNSEEDFQERKNPYSDIVSMIESYEKDPQAVRAKLSGELNECRAGELLALVVFLSDGYLEIPAIQIEENAQRRRDALRFFNLASSLPLDLQMVLCNRVSGLGDSIVKRIYSEKGFQKFASGDGK